MPPRSGAGKRAGAASAIAAVVLSVTAAACDGRRAGQGDARTDASPAGSSSASAARSGPPSSGAPAAGGEAPPRGPAPDPHGRPCRIMASEDGPPPNADATTWLDVAAKGNVTVRVLETGRELRFEGPGRVRPCGGDVALVAEGAAVGLPGSGEGPGSEQWVATACGVATWPGGIHRFESRGDICKLQTSLGSARLYAASDMKVEEVAMPDAGSGDGGADAASRSPLPAAADPWLTVHARRALALRAKAPASRADLVKNALGACHRASIEAEAVALRLRGDAPRDMGDLAARSITLRRTARAACAIAAVRASAGAGGPDAAAIAAIAADEARWR